MPMPVYEFDPREAESYLAPMPPREQLAYRLRTDALIARFRKELPALLKEASKLAEEMVAAA